jgi:hypothetical protein
MPIRTIELPKNGFALEIDGRLKTEFSTREGAEQGAIELKRRFPMLQISGRLVTRAIDGCAFGFYPSVERFPLRAGLGGVR